MKNSKAIKLHLEEIETLFNHWVFYEDERMDDFLRKKEEFLKKHIEEIKQLLD